MAEIANQLFARLSYIVIDDSPAMRAALRITISTFGGTKIDLASTPFELLNKMGPQGRQYDVILCDYNLGEDRDGQQLLEELRHRRLLRKRTVFIMVTGECQYERVVQAVEHAPDDYLIKPFPGVVLRDRLLRQLEKKVFLGPIFDALDDGNTNRVLEICDELEPKAGRFSLELLRIKAEICSENQRIQTARTLYKRILDSHDLPWARYGLARLAYRVRNLHEAVHHLEAVTQTTPRYFAAHDFLARVLAELGETEKAQKVLETTTALAGRNVQRRRELAQLALQNDDMATADANYRAVIQYGRHSVTVGPADYLQCSIAALALGRGELEAMKHLAEAERDLGASEALAASRLAVRGVIAAEARKTNEARTLLLEANKLANQCSDKDATPCLLAGLRGASKLGDNELTRTLAANALRKSHCDPEVTNLIRATLRQAGTEKTDCNVDDMARQELASINNRAVMLAKEGKMREAMEILVPLAHQQTAPAVALLNAGQALIMCMETEGWNDDWVAECARFIVTARDREAGNPKIAKLEAMLRQLASRFGIEKLPVGISLLET